MMCPNVYVFLALIAASQCLKFGSIQKQYEKAVKAHKDERWTECIAKFEESLHLYKLYKSVIINCRLQCNSQTYDTEIKENIEDLRIYERFFNRKQCLTKCQKKGFKDLQVLGDIDETILNNMQLRKPYEYLHLCYFEINNLPKAASAVYTYLIANPNDEKMIKQLQYYTEQPEVNVKEVTDLLSDDYHILYSLGIKAYNQNNWADAAANMEEVLTDYLASDNSCRMECEHQPEQEWSSEFSITLSNNMAALLHCQQQCQDKLKALNYDSGLEFIADILNYIQICYYRLDRYDDAAKAATTFLMILPNDEDMLANKNIYRTIADPKSFTIRSDIAFYYQRDGYEKKLLNIFHRGSDNNIDSITV